MNSTNEQIVELFFNLPSRSDSKHDVDEPIDQQDHSTSQRRENVPGYEAIASTASLPSIEQIWIWLNEIPDPEIPVISLVDLGIIRQVQWKTDVLVVSVTPTYSGCPATRVIQADIELHLHKRGVNSLRLERQLSPAWTTDWISEAGREKLKRYGIAPPQQGVAGAGNGTAGVNVVCPHCQSSHTRKVSQFGSTPCKASYQCSDCLEPFDYFKCL